MILKAGDTAIGESDGRTPVRLLLDVTAQIEPGLPEHQRYWVAELPSGARRLAIVHREERIVEVRERRKLDPDVRAILDAEIPPQNREIAVLARRALAANAIVAATNVSDLEDEGGTFAEIHDLANDLTIDTQRALARALGWLVGSDDMSDDIPDHGAEMFDELTHGNASDEQIKRAAGFSPAMTEH